MATVCLGIITLVFGAAVFLKGGVEPDQWYLCLATIGLTGAVYWLTVSKLDRAPASSLLLRLLLVALAAVCILQLLPLPVEFVRLVSPVRAELHDALTPVLGASPRTTLTIVPAETVQLSLRILGFIVLFFLLRELCFRWTEHRWAVVVPFVVIAALQAALGLYQRFGADLPLARGTYVNRNHFSGLLEMALPFAIMYAVAILRTNPELRRDRSPATPALKASVWLVIATVMLLAVIYSLSRMGFLASLAALFVMGATALGGTLEGRKRWLPVTAVAALVAAGFVFLPTDALILRFASMAASDEISEDTRAQIWRDTTLLVRDYPVLGCGLGGYESALYRYKTVAPMNTVDFAHNDYLQLLAETGVAGFLVFLLLGIRLIIRALSAAGQPPGTNARYLGIACVGGITAIALHSLVDFNLYIPANAMLLVWIAAVAEGLEFAGQPRRRRRPRRRAPITVSAGATAR